MIAIVGGDGSGKTLAVSGLSSWLGKNLDVVSVHLGKPRWSWTTRVVRTALKIARAITRRPYVSASTLLYTQTASCSVFDLYCLSLRAVCLARDRHRAYARCRRLATTGRLVLCDRFSLPEATTMEVPIIDRFLNESRPSALLEYLMRLERRYVDSIMPPEVLLVLRVHSAIAAQRRVGEDSRVVTLRNDEIGKADWSRSPARLIDANRSRGEVLAELKTAVWAAL